MTGRRVEDGEARRMNYLKENLGIAQHDMEYLINSTPTGERRNKLSEANIHLGAMRKILEELR